MPEGNAGLIKNEKIGRRDLFKLLLPGERSILSGRLMPDVQRCSLCGACVKSCPSGALQMEDAERIVLIFRDDLCDACGRCLEACPEDCLRLEMSFVVSRQAAVPVALVEGSPACCSRCGVVVGPQVMVERVRLKLKEQTGVSTGAVESRSNAPLLCPACKLEGDFTGDWQWTR